MALLKDLLPTGRPGVFYKEHETRRHGVRKDRQWILRYTINGKTRTEAFGWASSGLTEIDAEKKIAEFKSNYRNDSGPVCMADVQALIDAERAAREEAERAADAASIAADEAERNRPTIKRLWELYTEARPGMKLL